jgi:UDP-N-acetyl-D-glucosamine dehydrogenase
MRPKNTSRSPRTPAPYDTPISKRSGLSNEAGNSYIEDIPSDLLREMSGRIHATSRYARLAKADAILVCVPTPLTPNREPDLGPLIDSIQALAEVLQADQLVVLESTTYPGTTRERVVPILEESGLAAGRDFHVAFSPERVDPGRTDFTLRNTPKVVSGLTEACAERAEAIYGMVGSCASSRDLAWAATACPWTRSI